MDELRDALRGVNQAALGADDAKHFEAMLAAQDTVGRPTREGSAALSVARMEKFVGMCVPAFAPVLEHVVDAVTVTAL